MKLLESEKKVLVKILKSYEREHGCLNLMFLTIKCQEVLEIIN